MLMQYKKWLAISVLVAACGDNEEAPKKPDPVPGPYNTCSVDADCAWGEIDHEILESRDCLCLYGCPYVALSKKTISRRAAQYEQLCDPERNGAGEPCGIDDCALPPSITCNDGVCGAKPSE